jgi:hypothetical protein
MRMRHIIGGLSGSTTFFHIVINGMICGKNVFEHKMCILIFPTTLSETFTVLRKIQRDMI